MRAWMRWSQCTVRRHRDRRQAGGHELQQRHLRGRVLHRDAVGSVVGVVDAALEADRLRVVGVGEQHLLGERQRAAEAVAGGLDVRAGSGRTPLRRARSAWSGRSCQPSALPGQDSGTQATSAFSRGSPEVGPRLDGGRRNP